MTSGWDIGSGSGCRILVKASYSDPTTSINMALLSSRIGQPCPLLRYASLNCPARMSERGDDHMTRRVGRGPQGPMDGADRSGGGGENDSSLEHKHRPCRTNG